MSSRRIKGFFSFSQPCPQCRGVGANHRDPLHGLPRVGDRDEDPQCQGAGPRRGPWMATPCESGARARPGRNGGPSGDLLVRVRVASSRTFGRKGNDLTLTVPITYSEAVLGTKLEVPTLNGEVKLKIPAGTPSGKTFRVRGKGVIPERGRPGDLLVKVEVAVPTKVGKEEKQLIEDLAQFETDDVRSHLR